MNLFDEHDLVERKREVTTVFNLQLLPYTRLHTLSFRFEQFKKKQKHAINIYLNEKTQTNYSQLFYFYSVTAPFTYHVHVRVAVRVHVRVAAHVHVRVVVLLVWVVDLYLVVHVVHL